MESGDQAVGIIQGLHSHPDPDLIPSTQHSPAGAKQSWGHRALGDSESQRLTGATKGVHGGGVKGGEARHRNPGNRTVLTLRCPLAFSTWDAAGRGSPGAAAGGLNHAGGGEAETKRSELPRRAPPGRAQPEPSRAEPSTSRRRRPAPRAPAPTLYSTPLPSESPDHAQCPTRSRDPPARRSPELPQPSRRRARHAGEREEPPRPRPREPGPALPDSAPFAPRPSRRGPSPGSSLQPISAPSPPRFPSLRGSRLHPALLAQRSPSPPLPSSRLGLSPRLLASSSLGFPFCSRRSRPRRPLAYLLVLVPRPPYRFPALSRERGPVGGVGSRPRWGWGPVPPARGSCPTPSSSPAHNRSVRSEGRVGWRASQGTWGFLDGVTKGCGVRGLEMTLVGEVGCTGGEASGSWSQLATDVPGSPFPLPWLTRLPLSLQHRSFPGSVSLLPTWPPSLPVSAAPYPFPLEETISISSIFAVPVFRPPSLPCLMLSSVPCSLLSPFLPPHPWSPPSLFSLPLPRSPLPILPGPFLPPPPALPPSSPLL